MTRTLRAPSRALITMASAVTLFSATHALSPATASAHVHVDAEGAAPGTTAVLTFRVPGESETGSVTTQLKVRLPDVASARTELMPGWTARLDRDAASGAVRSVTWTAAPGVGISSDQFALFRVSVTLPDETSVALPTTQTYSDGQVVTWDQPPLPDGSEPEYPAPTLELTAGTDGHEHGTTPPTAAEPASAAQGDDTARWLAGAALVVAAIGVAAALFRGRRA